MGRERKRERGGGNDRSPGNPRRHFVRSETRVRGERMQAARSTIIEDAYKTRSCCGRVMPNKPVAGSYRVYVIVQLPSFHADFEPRLSEIHRTNRATSSARPVPRKPRLNGPLPLPRLPRTRICPPLVSLDSRVTRPRDFKKCRSIFFYHFKEIISTELS